MVSVKLGTSCSFRAVAKTFSTLCLYLDLGLCSPSYGTVLIWTKKIGVFSLRPAEEKADDWILVVDESISIGHERLLVVYGVRCGKMDFDRALRYTDLAPLLVKASGRWTADIIEKEIVAIEETHGKVKYIVADGGSAITKAIRSLSKEHVYDITHKMAWFLKNMYAGDSSFMGYTKEMAVSRSRLTCTALSHLAPPKQRADSRFMNLDALSCWGCKALDLLEGLDKKGKAYEALEWVKGYEKAVREMQVVNTIAGKIKATVKTRGLSGDILKELQGMVKEISPEHPKASLFCKQILMFMEETLKKLPNEKKVLCTSDIIESSFGKYKGYISHNPMLGFTNLALCLAAFTNDLENCQLKENLEKTTVNHLRLWSDEYIGTTNLSRRRRDLKINRV